MAAGSGALARRSAALVRCGSAIGCRGLSLPGENLALLAHGIVGDHRSRPAGTYGRLVRGNHATDDHGSQPVDSRNAIWQKISSRLMLANPATQLLYFRCCVFADTTQAIAPWYFSSNEYTSKKSYFTHRQINLDPLLRPTYSPRTSNEMNSFATKTKRCRARKLTKKFANHPLQKNSRSDLDTRTTLPYSSQPTPNRQHPLLLKEPTKHLKPRGWISLFFNIAS